MVWPPELTYEAQGFSSATGAAVVLLEFETELSVELSDVEGFILMSPLSQAARAAQKVNVATNLDFMD